MEEDESETRSYETPLQWWTVRASVALSQRNTSPSNTHPSGFAQEPIAAHAVNAHELRVPARHQERHERELRRPGREQGRKKVPLQVMNAHGRHAERERHRMRERSADQEGAGEPRALRVTDTAQVAGRFMRFFQHLARERHQPADVVARSELRHHAAVRLVHRDLRMHGVREQPSRAAVVDRYPGFIAGRLDPKNQHSVDFDTIQPLSRGWNV